MRAPLQTLRPRPLASGRTAPRGRDGRSCSKAADLLLERQQDIAQLVTEETGGVFGWGMFNVDLAAGMMREAAAQATGWSAR